MQMVRFCFICRFVFGRGSPASPGHMTFQIMLTNEKLTQTFSCSIWYPNLLTFYFHNVCVCVTQDRKTNPSRPLPPFPSSICASPSLSLYPTSWTDLHVLQHQPCVCVHFSDLNLSTSSSISLSFIPSVSISLTTQTCVMYHLRGRQAHH